MIKLIIADMDGTVVDSMAVLSTLGITLLATLCNQELDAAREHYEATVGQPFAEQVNAWSMHIQPGQSIRRTVEAYEMVHLAAASLFRFTPFGRSLLEHAHDREPFCQFALVSSTRKPIIQMMPQLRYIPWAFVGGYEGNGTEKAMQIRRAMKQLNIFQPEMCYVGDSASDSEIAAFYNIPFFEPSATTLQEIIAYDKARGEPSGPISGQWAK